jgi:hypothetical protein
MSGKNAFPMGRLPHGAGQLWGSTEQPQNWQALAKGLGTPEAISYHSKHRSLHKRCQHTLALVQELLTVQATVSSSCTNTVSTSRATLETNRLVDHSQGTSCFISMMPLVRSTARGCGGPLFTCLCCCSSIDAVPVAHPCRIRIVCLLLATRKPDAVKFGNMHASFVITTLTSSGRMVSALERFQGTPPGPTQPMPKERESCRPDRPSRNGQEGPSFSLNSSLAPYMYIKIL